MYSNTHDDICTAHEDVNSIKMLPEEYALK